jgi:predicted acetyltransferase
LLIRVDDRLAGFALLNQWSALQRPLDHAVAEFFVLRKYRRARVGMRAAQRLFQHYPGWWEVPVAFYNQPALLFWRRTIEAVAAGTMQEYAGDGKRWAGPVLRFNT